MKIIPKIKSSLKGYENINKVINLELLNKYAESDDFTLVDAGCGSGENLMEIILNYPKAKIIGIDNHKPDLNNAKKRFLDKAKFLYGDCLNMEIKSETIDIVLSNQVIEHITRYEKYLHELKRILKSNGILILSTPNFHNPKNILLKLFFKKPIMRWENNQDLPPEKYRGHVKEFFEEELITLLQKNNFKLLDSQPITPKPSLKGNVPFILYRFLEYLFYIITKPFVSRGYGKNHNMIFKKV